MRFSSSTIRYQLSTIRALPKEPDVDNPMWTFFFGPSKEKTSFIEFIRDLPVFEGLGNNELLTLERMIHVRRYSPGEVIFKENAPGAGMYIVKLGSVAIRKNVGGGHEIDLAVIPEHSFFGEMALIDEMPRSAAAIAQSETVLLAFSKPDLEKIRDRNPKFALKIIFNIARLLCKRLVKANENLEQMQRSAIKQATIPEDNGG